jgi:hypothetical protein
MTSQLRRLAGAVTIVEALWVVYLSLTPRPALLLCPSGCPPLSFSATPAFHMLTLALVALLVVDGVMGVWGAWFAYPAGALFSATNALLMGYLYWVDGPSGSQGQYMASYAELELVAGILALVGLAINLVAMRHQSRLSEQANPMNLPVFG